jgi:hypothetical protein
LAKASFASATLAMTSVSAKGDHALAAHENGPQRSRLKTVL